MIKFFKFFFETIIHNFYFFLLKKKYFIIFFLNRIFLVDHKINFTMLKYRNIYDLITIKEIFMTESYSLRHLRRYQEISFFFQSISENFLTPLILDIGSNIGASTKYFSINYVGAKIISLEPDINNFEILKENINAENHKNCFNLALACEHKFLKLNSSFLDPRASRLNHELRGDTECESVNDILKNYPENKFVPFIIKIDVEGSEQDIFSKNTEWIDKFKIIIIEPHDWLLTTMPIKNFLINISKKNRDFLILNENILSIRND